MSSAGRDPFIVFCFLSHVPKLSDTKKFMETLGKWNWKCILHERGEVSLGLMASRGRGGHVARKSRCSRHGGTTWGCKLDGMFGGPNDMYVGNGVLNRIRWQKFVSLGKLPRHFNCAQSGFEHFKAFYFVYA